MVEGELTGVLDKEEFNAAGVHGDPEKVVIADPENAQLDQAWLSYNYGKTGVKAGRQVITLDGHRWVGHVGWRQNRQTYDAAAFTASPIEGLNLFYGYLANVIRIFGSDAPSEGANAEDFESDSHLLNASYSLGSYGKVTGYGYFLDLEDAPGKIAGSDTIGISYAGTCTAVKDFPFGVYLGIRQPV